MNSDSEPNFFGEEPGAKEYAAPELSRPASSKGNTELVLNETVLYQLVERGLKQSLHYLPSQVVHIVHRTIPDSDLNEYQQGDRNFIRRRADGSHGIGILQGQVIIIYAGKEMIYEDIVLPGSRFEKECLETLDNKFESLRWDSMSDTQKFEAAALFAVAVVAGHIKPDGNLRTGVGLAKYLIDKFSSMNLSIGKLNDKKVELNRLLDEACLWLLPEEFTPEAITQAIQPGSRGCVNIESRILTQDKYSLLQGISESSYFGTIEDNIVTNVSLYEPNPENFYRESGILLNLPKDAKIPNVRLQYICEQLTQLFESCSDKKV